MYGANDVSGLENEHERDEIAQQQAGQKHVRDFPTGGLYDGRVIVLGKHGDHQQGDGCTQDRKRHCPDGPAATGPQIRFRYFRTILMAGVGYRARGTGFAYRFVVGRTDLKTYTVHVITSRKIKQLYHKKL